MIREALQRAEANGPNTEGVKEKVRGVVEELSGMEDDTNTTKSDAVTGLNTSARDLRKHIYSSQAEIGGASVEQLQDVKDQVDVLVDKTYEVRELEEECPTCIVNSGAEEAEAPKQSIEGYGAKATAKRKKFLDELAKDNVQDELF